MGKEQIAGLQGVDTDCRSLPDLRVCGPGQLNTNRHISHLHQRGTVAAAHRVGTVGIGAGTTPLIWGAELRQSTHKRA